MNIYQSTAPVRLNPGIVLMNKSQARDRNHVLVKTKHTIDALNLSDAELELLGDAEGVAVYKLIGETHFKAGEIFGYDGELNKARAKNLKPAEQVLAEAAAVEEIEADIDEQLVDAILSLEEGNAAHFNQNNGKPELAVLKGLLNRNITGKERDAAWEYVQAELAEEEADEDQAAD